MRRAFLISGILLIVLMIAGGAALVFGPPLPMLVEPFERPSVEVLDGTLEPEPPAAGAPFVDLPEDPPSVLSSDGSAFAERALFEPMGQPTVSGSGLLAGYELRGTVASEDQGFALLARPGSDAVVVVRSGDILAGWRLVGIAPDRAIFERGGRRATLVLD